MTPRRINQYRRLRKLALIVAASPLFLAAQCMTGVSQVSENMLQALPSTVFGIMQGYFWAPLEILIQLLVANNNPGA